MFESHETSCLHLHFFIKCVAVLDFLFTDIGFGNRASVLFDLILGKKFCVMTITQGFIYFQIVIECLSLSGYFARCQVNKTVSIHALCNLQSSGNSRH